MPPSGGFFLFVFSLMGALESDAKGPHCADLLNLEPRRAQQRIGHVNVRRLAARSLGYQTLRQIGPVVSFTQVGSHEQV